MLIYSTTYPEFQIGVLLNVKENCLKPYKQILLRLSLRGNAQKKLYFTVCEFNIYFEMQMN